MRPIEVGQFLRTFLLRVFSVWRMTLVFKSVSDDNYNAQGNVLLWIICVTRAMVMT